MKDKIKVVYDEPLFIKIMNIVLTTVITGTCAFALFVLMKVYEGTF